VSDLLAYLARAMVFPAAFGAAVVVVPMALGERARLGRFALAGVSLAMVLSLGFEIGTPALVRSLPAGLGEAWGDPGLAPERWHRIAFVAAATLAAALGSLSVGRASRGGWLAAARIGTALGAVAAALALAFLVEFPGEDARRRTVEGLVVLGSIAGLRVLARSDVRRPPGPAGLGGPIFLFASGLLFAALGGLLVAVSFPSLAVACVAAAGASLLMAIATGWAARRCGTAVIDGSGVPAIGLGLLLATLAAAGLAYGRGTVPDAAWLAIPLAPWLGVLVTPLARVCVRPSASVAWRLVAVALVPLVLAGPSLRREFLPAAGSDAPAPAAEPDPMDGIYGS